MDFMEPKTAAKVVSLGCLIAIFPAILFKSWVWVGMLLFIGCLAFLSLLDFSLHFKLKIKQTVLLIILLVALLLIRLSFESEDPYTQYVSITVFIIISFVVLFLVTRIVLPQKMADKIYKIVGDVGSWLFNWPSPKK
jgi:CDP-diglyceride synthetase